MSCHGVDIDAIYRSLSVEPHLGSVERRDDALAVFIGSTPLFVTADTEHCRLAIWTNVAGLSEIGGLRAANAAIAYNSTHYHETGMTAAVSVQLQQVLLGCSKDARSIRIPEIAEVLLEVERQRRVVQTYLAEAPLDPESAQEQPASEDYMVRV